MDPRPDHGEPAQITSREMIARATDHSERLVAAYGGDDPTPMLLTVDEQSSRILTTMIPGGMYNAVSHAHMGQAVAQTIARTCSTQSALIMPVTTPDEAMMVLYTQSRMNPFGAQLLHTRALVGAIDRNGPCAQILTWSMPVIDEHGWMHQAISHGHWMAHTATTDKQKAARYERLTAR